MDSRSQSYTELVRGLMEDVTDLLSAYGVQVDRSLYSTLECRVCDAITDAIIIAAQATAAT